ncbi:hypothetical protein KY285_012469 [Solanum tuberosum]|nr:hypothetical protein KY284_024775 [Solanum tuberosum]KAH0736762.1 hypothetical protein KY285_012469 [Solanum tuberosum]
MRLLIRPSYQQLHGDLTTWEYSPGEELHPISSPSKMAGPITDDKASDEQAAEKMQCGGGAARDDYSMEEEVHLTNISINTPQEHNQKGIQASLIDSTTKHQAKLKELSHRIEPEQMGTNSQDYAGPNGQNQDQHPIEEQRMEFNSKQGDTRIIHDQKDQQDQTKPTTLEVIEVESSSHFSFGVKPTDIISNNGEQQGTCKSQELTAEDNQTGKAAQSTSNRKVVSLDSNEDQANANTKRQKKGMLNDQVQGRGDIEPQQQADRNQKSGKNESQSQLPDHGGNAESNKYQKDFPKIFSNFDRHTTSNQKNQQTTHPNQPKGPTNLNENQNTKHDLNVEPVPYTVVQILAARLRKIHATHATTIELNPPRHTTKQGQPAVIYDMDDFLNKLIVDCQYTLIGKFSTTMPKIELIQKSFILQTQLNGGGGQYCS